MTVGNMLEDISELREISDQNFSACIQCGICDASCPAFQDSSFKASPRIVNNYLINKKLNRAITNEIVDFCMECMLCKERCPKQIDMRRVVGALRFYIIKHGGKIIKLSDLPRSLFDEIPQIAFLQLFIGALSRGESPEFKKFPIRKIQRSDDVWDLEIDFVKEIIYGIQSPQPNFKTRNRQNFCERNNLQEH